MELGLGTVQFGLPYGISNKAGQVNAEEALKIIRFAADNGLKTIDTAAGYGNSETVLGKCLSPDHDFLITTKTLPLKVGEIRESDVLEVQAAFERSLRQLGQLSINGLLVHQAADLLSPGGERLYAMLQQMKDDGKVKKIGVSVYDNREVDCLLDKYSIDLVQLPLNVFDQRLVGDGTIHKLHAASVEIHVRSAFLQGLLLMPSKLLPEYFAELKPRHEAYTLALERAGVSPLAAALGFFYHVPEVSTVLVGVNTSVQLQECIDASRESPPLDFASFSIDSARVLDPRLWVGHF